MEDLGGYQEKGTESRLPKKFQRKYNLTFLNAKGKEIRGHF